MARKQKLQQTNIPKEVSYMDRAAKMLIANVDPGYNERQLLSDRDAKIQDIINSELDLAKGVSNGSIIDFVSEISKRDTDDKSETGEISLFTEDIGNVFGYFQELHKNRYIELTDLKFITKFIPAIGEAVNTTLDAIVSSDDFSDAISRNLILSQALTEQEQASIIAEIKSIEESQKLPNKLKNIVIKNTLISGSYYIYTVPYAELFAEYSKLEAAGAFENNPLATNKDKRVTGTGAPKIKNKKNAAKETGFILNSANESVSRMSIASESTFDIAAFEASLGAEYTDKEKSSIREGLTESLSCIETLETPILMEALEGYRSVDIMRKNTSAYANTFGDVGILSDKDIDVTANTEFSDGTSDAKKASKFHTTGSYSKMISANRLVPVEVYNQTIGYLYVYDTTASQKVSALKKASSETSLISATSNIFNSTKLSESKKNKAAQAIIDTITDGILANFSDKFVNTHSDFKDLIADCIVSSGLMNNSYQIQFIPAHHMVPFVINENEDGVGQSILTDALFPAKLLLSLIVSKLLTYMNNGGDKRIAYVRKGPIDVSSSNHTQRVIRMLQESNITFSDLLSTNISFAKFNRNTNIQIPLAKNGDRLVDFETQEGQNVSMDTEMENYLEKLAIMGTGVPSVIMEYTDVADFSKSLVTANIKFAGRVASLQADIESAITIYYKKLLTTSSLDENLKNKAISGFEYKLTRPKVLSNANMSDYLSTMQSSIDAIINLFMGQNANEPEDEKVKQQFSKNLAMNMLPFMDWDEFEELYKKAKIEVAKQQDLTKTDGSTGDDLGGEDDY